MADRAFLRKLAIHLVDDLVKEAQGGHPLDAMRRNAGYTVGMHDLNTEFGIGTGTTDQMRAMVENPDYYNRLRALYDQHMGAPTLSEAVEAQKQPVNISAENAPKVVSTPK